MLHQHELDEFEFYLKTQTKLKDQSVPVYLNALVNTKTNMHSTASKHYERFLHWRTDKLKRELDRPQVVVEKIVEKIVHRSCDVKTISLIEEISTLDMDSDIKVECIIAIIKRWRGEVTDET